jgi:hypothetical protein
MPDDSQPSNALNHEDEDTREAEPTPEPPRPRFVGSTPELSYTYPGSYPRFRGTKAPDQPASKLRWLSRWRSDGGRNNR